MEFIEGVDLHDYVDRKGMLDPEEALRIIVQATKALDHAHRQGIVHRDVKPSNFLVTRRKGRLVVKMTDFGLSREANADEFRVTRAGTTVGTVDYISPEQARDSGQADIRSDLYSLGCTWYHLLAGKAPFPEGGLAERLHKHLNVEPPDVRLLNPRASRATAAVLRRLLAKRPADRYQTPADLLKDLVALKDGGSPTGRRALQLGLLNDDGDGSASARTAVIPSAKTKADQERSPAFSRRQSQGLRPGPAPARPPRPLVVHSRRRCGRAARGRRRGVGARAGAAPQPFFPHSDQASHDSSSVPRRRTIPPPPDPEPARREAAGPAAAG